MLNHRSRARAKADRITATGRIARLASFMAFNP